MIETNNSRRVHFLPENDKIIEIESHKDFSQKEKLAYWYTLAWLNEALPKASDIALEWEANQETSDVYLRGLEQFTDKYGDKSTRMIEQCINDVLDEQDAQWAMGEEDDHEQLAMLSQKVSKFSVALALLQATKDYCEAQRAYDDDESVEEEEEDEQEQKKKMIVKPAIIVADDSTSVCSDLSHPDAETLVYSIVPHSSCETATNDNDMECENNVYIIPATTTKAAKNKNKKEGRMKSLLSIRRVKAKLLNLKIAIPNRSSRISQSFKTICA